MEQKKGVPKEAHLYNLVTGLETRIKEEYEEMSKQLSSVTLSDVWDRLFPAQGHSSQIPKSKKVVDWVVHFKGFKMEYLHDELHSKRQIKLIA